MALTSIGRMYVHDHRWSAAVGAIDSNAMMQLNAAGNKIAFLFSIPRSGNITTLGVRMGAVAAAQPCRLSLQTVDGSGFPTGTSYGGSGTGVFTPAANAYSGDVTLGSPAAATAGDIAAVVVEFDSTVGDAIVGNFNAGYINSAFPYPVKYAGSWSKSNRGGYFAVAVGYDDGSFPACGFCPALAGNPAVSFNANSAANEYALQFTSPAALRVVGLWHAFGYTAGSDYEIRLYASDSTTPLAAKPVDGDFYKSSQTYSELYFASSVNLAAGTTYNASLLATTTSNLLYRSYSVANVAHWEALGLSPQLAVGTVSRGGGSWSSPTNTAIPCLGLIIDQVDSGSGGSGSSSAPIFSRRYTGF